MSQATIDRISNMIREIGGQTKTAATKRAMDDPGDMSGKSSHPSAMSEAEGNERPATEGEQTADNAAIMKDTVSNSPDSTSAATPGSTPKEGDLQVAPATPTGEDPSNEDDYKGDKDDPGTSHPASADKVGDKYAHVTRDWLSGVTDEQLHKLAADLGNDAAARVANGHFNPAPAKSVAKTAAAPAAPAAPVTKTAADKAATAGYAAAAALSDNDLEKVASEMVYSSYETAIDDAHRVSQYLLAKQAQLKRAEETDDPMGGSAEGEDHGSEEGEATAGAGPAGPGGDTGGSDLLAAMGGAGGDAGGMPPGGDTGGGAGPMPPEAAAMGGDGALQQLAMALLELGIDPAQLAAAAGGGGGMPPGGGGMPPEAGGMPPMGGMEAAMGGGAPAGAALPKLAMKVAAFKRSGKFKFTETKTAAERKVRDWMKSYVKEVVSRK